MTACVTTPRRSSLSRALSIIAADDNLPLTIMEKMQDGLDTRHQTPRNTPEKCESPLFGKCHKSSYCRQTPEHDPDHADIYEGFAMVGADFIVTNQSAGLNQPAEGPLPNPPFGQD